MMRRLSSIANVLVPATPLKRKAHRRLFSSARQRLWRDVDLESEIQARLTERARRSTFLTKIHTSCREMHQKQSCAYMPRTTNQNSNPIRPARGPPRSIVNLTLKTSPATSNSERTGRRRLICGAYSDSAPALSSVSCSRDDVVKACWSSTLPI